jgi:hypothetical protein
MSTAGLPSNAAEAGLSIARALEDAGIPYALGGALALGAHGVPRGTLDVDVNVFTSDDELQRVVTCLQSLGVEVDFDTARARIERDGMFVGSWAGMRIDVFTPSIPFSHEAAKTRVLLTDPAGQSAWFLSAEAIAIFKLLFYRPKDIADLERMSAVQGPALQRDYVRSWIVDMLGPDDERVLTWDRVSRFGAPPHE